MNLKIEYVPIERLNPAPYNPRKWTAPAVAQLKESINKYGIVDPLVVNGSEKRKFVLIGGHFRFRVAKELGIKAVPVVFIDLPDIEKEKELNLRLNKAVGEWDWDLLKEFGETVLTDVGFSSEELDDIFEIDPASEVFDLQKELEKLDIKNILFQKSDVYKLGDSKLMCGDSTIELDVLKLMKGEKADMCFTDPPYILNYLQGKQRHGKPTVGFGAKKNRRYLETDVLPPDFTEKWMAHINKVQKNDFSIICYENFKNIRTIWNEIEKYWSVKNMLVWRLPNRNQGYAAKHKFFSKYDIAILGATKNVVLNSESEEELLQNEYETALYAISGNPQWEGYEKGKKIQPTDFIDYKASDEKSSGQGIVFGTKPVEILLPYIKVLTKRGDLIVEPFGGSGSTLIAATKLKRRCYVMEKSPVYCEVIKNRWEKFAGMKAIKINENKP